MADETTETTTRGTAAGDGAQGAQEPAVNAEQSAQSAADAGQDEAGSQTSGNDGQPPTKSASTLLGDEIKGEGEQPEGQGEENAQAGDSFELPEGVEMDQAALDAALPVMDGLKLDHDQRQQLVSLYADLQQKAAVKAQADLQAKQEAWRQEITADPKHEEMLGRAKQALEAFGDETFVSMVKGSWLGDNPGIIRFLSKVGETLQDDTFVGSAKRPGGEKSIAETMFDDMFEQK
ncbi:MAG: hypothetical protein AB7D47_13165 [Desulfovibrio sp.]